MTAEECHILTLPDARTLGYTIYGSPPVPGVPTIFYFHGFCTSRLEASYLAATKAKPYIIAIDRPGTGLSSFQPLRRILDWPTDVLAVADHLKIKEFHIFGASGGGPYALVCAKEISRARLLSISVVSGIYPLSLGTQGMIFGVKAVLLAGIWLPTFLMGKLLDWEFGNAARNEDPKVFEEVFMKGMESGLFADWGFEIGDLDRNNVLLWHGKDDANAPCAMAEKAAKLIKGV